MRKIEESVCKQQMVEKTYIVDDFTDEMIDQEQ